ncbi:hypothetical protein PLESTB_001375000 [Pleodorina starrii]|uniref:Cleft lip and palate associated transmembrane protein n=1 Tax=Pleodorina starrii TaxID=330485 RepID=A0A9W6BUD7_9CHLO|nr:hypothetical protein PLESTM_000410100 [Pleodorina starrii]GLC58564.1 hypothetical protein PLESTB_001375000 [Pleodorina starrii]GLC74216.1 hypothetical protein PLESTF_001474700 [Pleodorina starrii]
MPADAVAGAAAAGAAAAAAGGAGGGQGQQQQQRQQGGIGSIVGMVLRMGVMWYFMNAMKGNKTPPPPQQAGADGQVAGGSGAGTYLYPAFERGSLVDMYMFLSEGEHYRGLRVDMSELIWSERGVVLGDSKEQRKDTYVYEPSDSVKNNGSVYIHMVLARAGASILPDEPAFDPTDLAYYHFQLNAHRPKPRNSTGVNLLSDNPTDAPKVDKDVPREILNYLPPNITMQLVDHYQAYDRNRIPPQLQGHLRTNPAGHYVPVVFYNDFWLLKDKYIPVNETLDNVTLHLELSYVSMTWWQLLMQMDQSFGMQVRMGMAQDGESDEIKRIFLEGNPVLLGLTFVVSMLHTVFDLLAFKNDIGFWKNNKSMEGLSARTVLINAFCQVVILLYLFDNDTSYVVLLSSVLGTGIELWKVTKAFDVSFNRERFPFVTLRDRASYSNKETKKYDADAMRYLSYALYPLVIGYSIYSLMYKTHKSWYSWILSSLVGAVYMFGFILMCPQLYLNYKLKSVAHLPWRQLTYKFLNTIIDDLFAFVIKMPLLHRLSVFRDDVVFLVYLYQRWIYRVDKSRANEFGWSEEQPAAAEAEPQPAGEGEAAPAIEAAAAEGSGAAPAADGEETGARRRKGAAAAAAAAAAAESQEEEDDKVEAEGSGDGKKTR